jgi:hypothetical protein
MTRKLFCSIGAVLVMLVAARTAPADIIDYGDFFGDNVTFYNVTESSAEVGQLFGPPTVAGDMLSFNAFNFSSQAANGTFDFVDGRLTMTITADPGKFITSLSLTEFGAYFMVGDEVLAIASALGAVTIGDDVYPGSFFFSEDTAGADVWVDGFTINFPAATEIKFTFDNILFTQAGLGDFSFIDKKGVFITVTTVPEPTSIILCGVMGGGLVFVGVRRRKAKARQAAA